MFSVFALLDIIAFVICVPLIVVMGPWRIKGIAGKVKESEEGVYGMVVVKGLITVISDIPYLLMGVVLGVSVLGMLDLRSKMPEDKSSEVYDIDVKEAVWKCFVHLILTIVRNILNLVGLPFWLITCFLLPHRFCNGTHMADGKVIAYIYTGEG